MDGVQYETLEDALNEAMDGDVTYTVRLLGNAAISDGYTYAPMTIEMDGFAITGELTATASLTLTGGTVKGDVTMDCAGGSFVMTAPAEAAAAITGSLTVTDGSAAVSGGKVGVAGTLYIGTSDAVTISGSEQAVKLTAAPTLSGISALYGAASETGDAAEAAVFTDDSYYVGGALAIKISTVQAGGVTPPQPVKPTLEIDPETAAVYGGQSAEFTVTYDGEGTLAAHVQKNGLDETVGVTVEKTAAADTYRVVFSTTEEAAGKYTFFVYPEEDRTNNVSASVTISTAPAKLTVGGDTAYYASVEAAVQAANGLPRGAAEITVLTDTTLNASSYYRNAGTALTLDLNGKRVESASANGSSAYIVLENDSAAAMTIKDSSTDGSGYIRSVQSGRGCSLTVAGGYIDNLQVVEGGLNLTGGTVNQAIFSPGTTLRCALTGTGGRVEYMNIKDSVKITGGLTGGSFGTIVYYKSYSGLLAPGYVFQKEDGSRLPAAESGTWKELTVQKCPHSDIDETSGVCAACGAKTAAKVIVETENGRELRYFSDFGEALDAATEPNSFWMLDDVQGDYTIAKSVIVNMGGHTLDGTVTVTGGKIGFYDGTVTKVVAAAKGILGSQVTETARIGTLTTTGGIAMKDVLFSGYGFKLYSDDGASYTWTTAPTETELHNVAVQRLPITWYKATFNGKSLGTSNKAYVGQTYTLAVSTNPKTGAEVKWYLDETELPAAYDETTKTYLCTYTPTAAGRYTLRYEATRDSYTVGKSSTLTVTECPHAAVDADGKCTVCGTQMMARLTQKDGSVSYHAALQSAFAAAGAESTIALIGPNQLQLPYGVYADTADWVTLDLNGRSLGGYALNVGGSGRSGKVTVADTSGGNGAIGLTVRQGGTVDFKPGNVNTQLLQLDVYDGGSLRLYGGHMLQWTLHGGTKLTDFLAEGCAYRYYNGGNSFSNWIPLTEARIGLPSVGRKLAVQPCEHVGADSDGKCLYCGQQMTVIWAKDGKTLGFLSLKDALAAADGGTVTLLANDGDTDQMTLLANVSLALNGYTAGATLAGAGNNRVTGPGTLNGGITLQGGSLDGGLTVGGTVTAKAGTVTLGTGRFGGLIVDGASVTLGVGGVYENGISIQSGPAASVGELLAENIAIKEDGSWASPTRLAGTAMSGSLEILTAPLRITAEPAGTVKMPYKSKGYDPETAVTFEADGTVNWNNSIHVTCTVNGESKNCIMASAGNFCLDFAMNAIKTFPVGEYEITITPTYDGYTMPGRTYTVQVVQSGTTLSADVYNGTTAAAEFTYGETITVRGSAYANGTAATAGLSLTANDVEDDYVVICDETGKEVSQRASLRGKDYTCTVDTRDLGAGARTLTVKYSGSGNMAANSVDVSVTVKKATPTIRSWGSYLTTTEFTGSAVPNPTEEQMVIQSEQGINLDLYDAITFKWYKAAQDGGKGDALNGAPVNGGDYYLEANFRETDVSLPVTVGTALTVKPRQAEERVEPAAYQVYANRAHTYEVELADYLAALNLGGGVTYTLTNDLQTYFKAGELTLSPTGRLSIPVKAVTPAPLPSSMGALVIHVKSANYAQITLTLPLEMVEKPTESLAVTMNGWVYGQTEGTPDFTAPAGSSTQITYAEKDGGALPGRPTDAGAYTVTVRCETDERIYTGTAEFSIEKAAGTLEEKPGYTYALNYTYGETITPPAAENFTANSTGAFTYWWTQGGARLDRTPEDAGVYTLHLAVAADRNHTAAAWQRDVTISPKELVITGLTVAPKTYDGTAAAIVTDVTFAEGITLPVGAYTVESAAFNSANVSEAQSVTATVVLADSVTNYTLPQGTFVQTGLTMEKAEAQYTAPVGNTLVYNGNDQLLVTAGSTRDGTLEYSLQKDGGFTADIPAGKAAGTYTVWYRVAGDGNHKDTAPASVTAAIGPKPVTAPTADTTAFTYDGGEKTYQIAPSPDYTVSGHVQTNAGSHTVTVALKEKANTVWADGGTEDKTFPFVIAKADAAVTKAPEGVDGLIYDKTAQVLVKAGEAADGEMVYSLTENGPYAAAIPTGTGAGTYTVWYKAAGDRNHNDTAPASVTVTIAKATLTGEPTLEAIHENGRTFASIKAQGAEGWPEGSFRWFDEDGNEQAPDSVVKPNTVYEWRFVPTESGNYHEVSGSAKLYIRSSSGGLGGGSSTAPTYPVTTPEQPKNGTVTVEPKRAAPGAEVTVVVKPDSGYTLETVTATDEKGNELPLTDKGDGEYSFVMPTGQVKVGASFMEDNSVLNFFYDVPNDSYYYEAVKWAAENGITTGVGSGLFGPDFPCTRAQIVTFLWRAAGSPAPKGASGFSDVPADAYYAKAVAWAVENGIAKGVGNGKFAPDAVCTRGQSVTFLWRALGSETRSRADFSDVPEDAYYAKAVAWAAASGVTNGVGGGRFAPDRDCTRAQIVVFLYRSYQGK